VNRFSFLEWNNGPVTLRGSAHAASDRGGPWVVFCHGLTGQRLGPHYLFVKLSRMLEAMGVSSLRFDFAGSGESEGAFADLSVDSMVSDCLSAARLVRGRFFPSRLALLGHSFGGAVSCLAAAGAGADRCILIAPVTAPFETVMRHRSFIAAAPNERGMFENGPHEMRPEFLGGVRAADPLAALAGSPVKNVLVVQGDADEVICATETAAFVNRLQAAGITTQYRVVGGADHNFSTVASVHALCAGIGSWTRENVL